MTWVALKARTAMLFGVLVAIAGVPAVLHLAALLALQLGMRLQARFGLPLPQELLLLEGQPLPAAAAFGLAGVIAVAIGVRMVQRQRSVLRRERQHREDRLRRVAQYRESSRLEPSFGPEGTDRRKEDAPSRRVA